MPMRRNTIGQRLNIVRGQIAGLIKIIEKGEDCRKVTAQFYAVNSGIKEAMALYFKENLFSCLRPNSPRKRKTINFLLKEAIKNK